MKHHLVATFRFFIVKKLHRYHGFVQQMSERLDLLSYLPRTLFTDAVQVKLKRYLFSKIQIHTQATKLNVGQVRSCALTQRMAQKYIWPK